jgi:hypothetical protein
MERAAPDALADELRNIADLVDSAPADRHFEAVVEIRVKNDSENSSQSAVRLTGRSIRMGVKPTVTDC